MLRQLWQELADPYSRYVSLYGVSQGATVGIPGLGFRVECVGMWRPPPHPNLDNRFGRGRGCRSRGFRGRGCRSRGFLGSGRPVARNEPGRAGQHAAKCLASRQFQS